MIITVTLNPCIDRAILVNKLQIDMLNRCISSRVDAAGKGINVSIYLSALESNSIATGFLGILNNQIYFDTFKKYGVENDFVFVDDYTRTNIKIIDVFSKQQTDFNEKGFKVEDFHKKELINKLNNLCDKNSFVVFSGSMPVNFTTEDYKCLVDLALSKGAKVIVDSEGENLKYAIEKKVFLIKPNIHEFEQLLNTKINNINIIAKNAKEICNKGVENVIVSLGSEGAIFVRKDIVYYSKCIDIEVKSTSGAGDSMVAAFLNGIQNNMSFEEIVKQCLAVSQARIMMEGALPGEKETINKLLKEIVLERIEC